MDNLLYAQAFENKLNKSYGYEFQAIFFEIMKNIYKDDNSRLSFKMLLYADD